MISIEFAFVRNYTKDRVIKQHSHQCFELVAYLDAVCECTLNKSEKIFMSSNQVMIIPPNVAHREKHKGYSKILAIGFKTDNKDLTFENFQIHTDLVIINSITEIRKELGNKQIGYSEVIANYLSIILHQFKRKLSPFSNEKNTIKFAIKYIDEYFNTNIDLNSLASNAGYTTDYFRILFKEKTGMNPKKYINNKKIEHAKKLLSYSNLNVTEIAYECGFNYVPQFLVFFKKNLNMTPKQYRNSIIK